jgi:hypothetical protein
VRLKQFPFNTIYLWILCALIFLIPSNLFLKFAPHSAFVHGLFLDYLLPKLYVSDLPIVALFMTWIVEKFASGKLHAPKIHWTTVILFSVFFLSQFFTAKPLASVWFFVKLMEWGWLAYFLFEHRSLLLAKKILFSMGVTLLFQSVVGLGQFFFQSSVFPSYLFLGEPRLQFPIGLAKDVFITGLKILPYGTTSHPNILGGFLALGSLMLIFALKKYPRIFDYWSEVKHFLLFAIGISVVTLFFTQSVSAWMSFGAGLVFLVSEKKLLRHWEIFGVASLLFSFLIVPIGLHFLASSYSQIPSIFRRDLLLTSAIQMWLKNPVFGVGLDNFTAQLENFSHSREVVRFVQPVHHVGFLWLAETGVIGMGVLGWIIFKLKKIPHLLPTFSLVFFIILPIFSLDHYLLTSQSGVLMVILFTFFAQKNLNN